MDYGAVSSIGSSMASIVTNVYDRKIAGIQAEAANYVRAQNNTVIDAENKRDAVLTNTQRWKQSVTNTRVLENAGKDRETIEVNYWRQADARKRANFADQIKFAEEEGRMAAAAAVAGVSGSVVDMLNTTAKLRRGMEDTAQARAGRQFASDKERLQFSTYWAHLDEMDYSLIMDNPQIHDFGVNTPRGTSLLNGINAKDVKNIANGVSDFFQPAASQLTIMGGEGSAPTDNYHEMEHS